LKRGGCEMQSPRFHVWIIGVEDNRLSFRLQNESDVDQLGSFRP
jgi:hypothetical protein